MIFPGKIGKVLAWIKINLLDGCPNCGHINKRCDHNSNYDFYRCSCGKHYRFYKFGW